MPHKNAVPDTWRKGQPVFWTEAVLPVEPRNPGAPRTRATRVPRVPPCRVASASPIGVSAAAGLDLCNRPKSAAAIIRLREVRSSKPVRMSVNPDGSMAVQFARKATAAPRATMPGKASSLPACGKSAASTGSGPSGPSDAPQTPFASLPNIAAWRKEAHPHYRKAEDY